jgi:hypothetical protein
MQVGRTKTSWKLHAGLTDKIEHAKTKAGTSRRKWTKEQDLAIIAAVVNQKGIPTWTAALVNSIPQLQGCKANHVSARWQNLSI